MSRASLELYDPRYGDLALKVEPLDAPALDVPRRSNYFGIYWFQSGGGTLWVDGGRHPFAPGSVLFVGPYQRFRVATDGPARGAVVQFHANFFCLEAHHADVGCNGVLFNDVHGVPVVQLDATHAPEFAALLASMREELAAGGLAQPEMLVAYLKILLIRATRLKLAQQAESPGTRGRMPPALEEFRRLVEEKFRTVHGAGAYARMMGVSPQALARLTRAHLRKTATAVIRERVLRQAQWELLHTAKSVKEIAAELGFDDVFYFSRLFRRATGCAPTAFREFETTIRAARNPSMPSP